MDREKNVILLVDDFMPLREVIRETLKKGNCGIVLEAENGRQALDILESEKVDLILSDFNMPEMDGLQLLRAVRMDSRFKEVPFIMLSSDEDPKLIIQAMSAGANEYLGKPFLGKILLQKVEKWLKK